MPKSTTLKILLVEDEDDFRETTAAWLTRKGHTASQAANAQEALAILERNVFDVAVVDVNMPGISGVELLQRMRSSNIDTQVIFLTGQGTIDSAVQAMKLGASDYLTKPFPLSDLERQCLLAWERSLLNKENRQLKAVIKRQEPKFQIVGSSKAMQEVFRLIDRVAPTDKAVLIQGETGTGKEVVARAIQQKSSRAEKPFVTINCAAMPSQLLESELFGHEKGAFTGATEEKPGLFEVADGGTLFIDELGELALPLQPKLLRVLEDGSLRRVGSNKERRVDVRIITATNRDLARDVEDGLFREDLYYRINVMGLKLPPLRERGSDVGQLIDHLLGSEWELEDSARNALLTCRWPGNIRQLINALDRAKILADNNYITLDDFSPDILDDQSTGIQTTTVDSSRLDEIEKAHLIQILEREKGSKSGAAKALGIHRRKLYRLLERHGLHTPEPSVNKDH